MPSMIRGLIINVDYKRNMITVKTNYRTVTLRLPKDVVSIKVRDDVVFYYDVLGVLSARGRNTTIHYRHGQVIYAHETTDCSECPLGCKEEMNAKIIPKLIRGEPKSGKNT